MDHQDAFQAITSEIGEEVSLIKSLPMPQAWSCLFAEPQSGEPIPLDTFVGRQVAAQHKLCVAAFGGFLDIALLSLQYLEQHLSKPEFEESEGMANRDREERDFHRTASKTLWLIASMHCQWFVIWMPEHRPLFDDTLVLAPQLHAWMAWMLRFLRRSSIPLTDMKTGNDFPPRGPWQRCPAMLLGLMSRQLFTVHSLPPHLVNPALHSLPSGFIDTLSCIVAAEASASAAAGAAAAAAGGSGH
ncbi:MAG: hypothetical protein WDW38_000052 [Sanguina aurantia]